MSGWLDRLRDAIDVLAGGPAPPAPVKMPAKFPRKSPLVSEPGAQAARTAALLLLDEECYGFFQLTLRRVGSDLVVHLDHHLDDSWWPAVAYTLERVAAASDE